ncbi:glycosyltransferase [Notoacmeibacter ruber]|uniref:Glycosyltransferase n=1 Tax=Notoacmeibacter ruber TaxID=2670375 RepID=A0A3L7J3F5_9HYPH|nr:glycosyltransferase [Notoacmeibacter ruber]RLQ84999.1 glycosyltransferase [Notoacmeibacter ruber]
MNDKQQTNVFVLSTGRCGSMTFSRACKHIENYTSGHETRTNRLGVDRLDYPPGHIESDNRLSWFLGRLDARFGDNAVYVHLMREPERVAESYNRRWTSYGSIMSAYARGIMQSRNEGIEVARDYVRTTTENIEHFLANKTRVHRINIDDPIEDFRNLWDDLRAEGDLDAALTEFSRRHNESAPNPENARDLTRADRLAIVLEKERRLRSVEREKARKLANERDRLCVKLDRLRRERDGLRADNKELAAARQELLKFLKEIRKDRLFRLIPSFRKYRKRNLEADGRVGKSRAIRPFRDKVWETALWSLYEDHAESAFEAMVDSDNQDMRIRAHWALARKQGSRGEVSAAIDHLSNLRNILSRNKTPTDIMLYEAAMRDAGGVADAADALIDQAERAGAPEVEVALTRASHASATGRPIRDWLAAINPLFEKAGVAQLSARDPNAPACFSNLTHDAPPDPRSNEAKVSVIMPAFEAEQTIDYAIDGVLGQTWTNLELIIVDDGSTDGTWARIEARAATDDRIVPIRRKANEGAYACRNAGLRAATGRFVTVNDADDWSHPERIALQAKHALDSGIACNTTRCVLFDEHLISEPRHRRSRSIPLNTSSFLFDREIALTLGGWDKVRHSADSEFLKRMQLAIRAEESKLVDDCPMAFVFARPGSLLRSGGPTGVHSAIYGARAEYHEAFTHWHKITENLALGPERPFPIPAITKERKPEPVRVAVLLVSDFSAEASQDIHIETLQQIVNAEQSVGLLHLPAIAHLRIPVERHVRSMIHAYRLPLIVPGMDAICSHAVLVNGIGLATLPRGLGKFQANAAYTLDEIDRSLIEAFHQVVEGASELQHVASIRDALPRSSVALGPP